jgi:dTDP-4-dehydrorhamnose 3,5-epimerase
VIFHETDLAGAFLIELEPRADERGFFANTLVPEEFSAHGLDVRVAQCGVAFNQRRATLRGLHYQAQPHAQAKLVRCTQGAIWDVIVDLRAGSPTERRWIAVELSAVNRHQLYVPEGCAHGYITLADESEVLYYLASPWAPQAERGLSWDDPTVAIRWPLTPLVISPRDAALPCLEPPKR